MNETVPKQNKNESSRKMRLRMISGKHLEKNVVMRAKTVQRVNIPNIPPKYLPLNYSPQTR